MARVGLVLRDAAFAGTAHDQVEGRGSSIELLP